MLAGVEELPKGFGVSSARRIGFSWGLFWLSLSRKKVEYLCTVQVDPTLSEYSAFANETENEQSAFAGGKSASCVVGMRNGLCARAAR